MAVPSNWRRLVEEAGAAYWDLSVFNGEPFGRTITYKNVDFSGAAFTGGVRAAFEDVSPVLVAFSFNAQLLGSDTVVTFAINESNIETLRDGSDAGAIEQLFYNIKCTPPGGSKQTHFAGLFNLQGA